MCLLSSRLLDGREALAIASFISSLHSSAHTAGSTCRSSADRLFSPAAAAPGVPRSDLGPQGGDNAGLKPAAPVIFDVSPDGGPWFSDHQVPRQGSWEVTGDLKQRSLMAWWAMPLVCQQHRRTRLLTHTVRVRPAARCYVSRLCVNPLSHALSLSFP